MFKKITSLFFMFLILLLLDIFCVKAIDKNIHSLIVDDVFGGQVIDRTITLVNTGQERTVVQLFGEGDVADWLKFYQDDGLDNIYETSLDANESRTVKLVFFIPKDVVGGNYYGFINIFNQPETTLSIFIEKTKIPINIVNPGISKIELAILVNNDKINKKEQLSHQSKISPTKYLFGGILVLFIFILAYLTHKQRIKKIN